MKRPAFGPRRARRIPRGDIARMNPPGPGLLLEEEHAEPVPVDLATLVYAHQRIIGSGGYLPEDVITVLEITTARHAELERIVVLVVVGVMPERTMSCARSPSSMP